ncbi:MAG: hypothetical protein H7257_08755 [Taibaiella sp.]|nr:hypothetical protein [Taibaiella sp.]
MKNLNLLLLLFVLVSSCATIKMGEDPDPNPKPYIKLRNGTVLHPETVKKTAFNIIADNKSYNRTNITAYCDGKYQYLPTSSSFFIPLIYTGKLNVYTLETITTTSYSNGTTSSSGNKFEYVTNGNDSLIKMYYKPLSKIIAPGTPAFDYLKLSRQNDRLGNAKIIAGLACVLGGFVIIGSGFSAQGVDGKRMAAGGLVELVGLGGMVYGAITKGHAKQNRRRAVACYNGVLPPLSK